MVRNVMFPSLQQTEMLLQQRRTRLSLLLPFFGTGYILSVIFHLLIWKSGTPPSTWVRLLYYDGLILLTYGALWLLLWGETHQRGAAPTRIFWSLAVASLLFLGVGYLVLRIGRPSDDLALPAQVTGFAYETGVPLTWAVVVQMNVLALFEALLAFWLLLQLRGLVLFKRTRQSERSWRWMLGSMAFSALLVDLLQPGEFVLALLLSLPVGLMLRNAFRVSWILYLTFRQKLVNLGLTVLATLVLSGTLAFTSGPAHEYVWHYSPALSSFVNLSLAFGILYLVTSFLSLLFHLPTTSDFQRKVDELAALHALMQLVSQVFDVTRLTETIVRLPVDAGVARAAWLALPDFQKTFRPRIVAAYNLPDGQSPETLVDVEALYQEVAMRRQFLLLEQALTDHRVRAQPQHGIGSLLAVPLIARNELLGVLFVTREVAYGFEQDDVEAITVFAAQAALALDNARLLNERLEKERLARELAIARDVQRRLLPQRLPRLPGLQIVAASISAQEVGGDYYDLLPIDTHRLAFIVADVAGKGTSAAFYMAELQGIFRALSPLNPDPAAFLVQANQALFGTLERKAFISAVYGIFDVQHGTLSLARAGHLPPILLRPHEPPRLLRLQGLGLGLDRGELFRRTLETCTLSLQAGDRLLLYTDGLIESRNDRGESFGYTRLLQSLETHALTPIDQLHRHLLDTLQQFTGRPTYDDDLTLVIFQWQEVPAAQNRRDRQAPQPQPASLPMRSSQPSQHSQQTP
ncbi:PP2C family protein-serine/threonine phosphatase [Rhodothermus profundi]|uniref:Serine phosphatase RsbU, regulator of sigma subunit n=1 Tax=Rhodothermus profundi TaxID=633813 RepID=A0A1M6VE47_9BACT|nr:GAF domain-containing SpoIIE family protein phosphatase [Rhodothermus profundi]SHK79762.1 Serine phosphatase RsbU, regulator of sigma subunit [Rhodothermus profundi]